MMVVEGESGSQNISLQLMSLSSALWPLSLLQLPDPKDSLIMRRYRDDRGPGSRALPLLTTPLPSGEKNKNKNKKQLPKVRGDVTIQEKKTPSGKIRNLILTPPILK